MFATLSEAFLSFGAPDGHVALDLTVSANSPSAASPRFSRHEHAAQSWTLREILIVAAIGAVFGVLYLGWVQVWLIGRRCSAP